jgi:hypothetical protein
VVTAIRPVVEMMNIQPSAVFAANASRVVCALSLVSFDHLMFDMSGNGFRRDGHPSCDMFD